MKESSEIAKKQKAELGEQKITRKEAIKKAGFAALSATTMMLLLSKNAEAREQGADGGKDWKDSKIGDGFKHGSNYQGDNNHRDYPKCSGSHSRYH